MAGSEYKGEANYSDIKFPGRNFHSVCRINIEILYPSAFYDINSGKKMSKPANTKDFVSTLVSENSILEPIRGKWYFYFPSSDSKIKEQRKKILKKNLCFGVVFFFWLCF